MALDVDKYDLVDPDELEREIQQRRRRLQLELVQAELDQVAPNRPTRGSGETREAIVEAGKQEKVRVEEAMAVLDGQLDKVKKLKEG